jgi:hypothetical protein
VHLAHARQRLYQLLRQQLGIGFVHYATERYRPTFDFDLDVGRVELRIVGEDFPDFLSQCLIRPAARSLAALGLAPFLFLSAFGSEPLLTPGPFFGFA